RITIMCTCRETVFVAVDEHNVRLHPAIPGKHNGPIRPPSGVDCFREVYFAGWLWCSFTGSGISVGITDSQLSRLQGIGGEGGIRTPDTLPGMPVFKTGAINHSATSPITTVLRHQIINNNNDQ